MAILAGILFKVKTKDGTLIVQINQPDATVEVFDDSGKVEITQPGEKGRVSISVDPGKHQLRVEKNGFKFYSQEFAIESGGEHSIKVALEPILGTPPTTKASSTNVPVIAVAKPDHSPEVTLDDSASSVAPLKGMPLRTLACNGTQVSDLSPLAGMNLDMIAISFTDIPKGMDAIRQMKSLTGIGTAGGNILPVDVFRKKYDAGEFGTPE